MSADNKLDGKNRNYAAMSFYGLRLKHATKGNTVVKRRRFFRNKDALLLPSHTVISSRDWAGSGFKRNRDDPTGDNYRPGGKKPHGKKVRK